jgi:hypothetical protein
MRKNSKNIWVWEWEDMWKRVAERARFFLIIGLCERSPNQFVPTLVNLSQVNFSQLFSKWLYFFFSQNVKEMCVLITLGVETESQYCSFTTSFFFLGGEKQNRKVYCNYKMYKLNWNYIFLNKIYIEGAVTYYPHVYNQF